MSSSGVKPVAEWPEWLGLAELSECLGVAEQTPRQWRARGVTPKPDVPGRPLWRKRTIVKWARETGRLSEGDG